MQQTDDCLKIELIAKRFKEPLSLLYFDLDGFKQINDSLGHDIGDLLLIKFVTLINECCRATDILARLGGDEFVLLLPSTSHKSLIAVIDKINALLSITYQLDNHSIEIRVSIGAVSVEEQYLSLITLNKLLKSADKSVYEAKKVEGTFTHFANEYCQI
ncbi:MAG: diguanylate cyclase (GGDEF)-like protein [Alteromonadaceae bacterium]|jgi:diguanylate cyclase (GGDEF)-like protein